MSRQDPTVSTRLHWPEVWARVVKGRVFKGFALAATGGMFLMLQACSSTEMGEPKYPIYMQDKPAEAVQTPAQAGDDRPVIAPPPVTAAAPKGNVETTDLAPPPPPPPPPPSTMASSSASSVPVAPVKDSRAAFVYVLQPHDTLYGVSRRFGVPVAQIYDLNGLAPNASLRIGQKILLPPSAVDKGVDPHASGSGMVKLAAALSAKPAVTPAPVPSAKAKPESAAAAKSDGKSTVAKPAVTAPARPATFDAPAAKPETRAPQAEPVSGFPSNEKLSQMGRGLFGWPLRGKILVPFGQLAPNVRNDGINIAADSGADVKAASDGVVVYEGNQVKELGNTVYIKHANGWYTGYSHLATMTVQNNQHVTRGQVIGTAGQTGTIDRPQLHFEIRYTPSTDIARPIDPMLVLPQ